MSALYGVPGGERVHVRIHPVCPDCGERCGGDCRLDYAPGRDEQALDDARDDAKGEW